VLRLTDYNDISLLEAESGSLDMELKSSFSKTNLLREGLL
jgi:hypothetical protein